MTPWSERVAGILAENADRTYLVDPERGGATYAQFLCRAAGLAQKLQARELRPGDRIGISLPNGSDFATLYFACLLGGFTAVPVNNALSLRDRTFVLSRSRVKALIFAEGSDDPFGADLKARRLSLGVSGKADLQVIEATESAVAGYVATIADDRLFSIHFTSGTTNLPKGVPHSVRSLLGNADAFNRAFGCGRDNRFVHVMPMAYMAGFLNTLLCAFTAGASIVLAPQFSAATVLKFWDAVVAHNGDLIWVSPTMLATLTRVDRGSAGVDYCRAHNPRIFSATAPLSLNIRREFEAKYGVDPVESYGLSELLLITANLGPQGSKDGAVGPLIAEARVEIRDEQGRVLGQGTDGSIFVHTPHASVGYVDYETGDPVPPADAWFDTGDIGHIDADGYLFVTGRRKDLIIRGGFNLSPRQIEEELLRHPGVNDVAVVGVPHSFYGEEIVAAIIVKPGRSLKDIQSELTEGCRRELGPTAVPDRFIAFDEFPMGNMGKIQKNKVRDQIVARTSWELANGATNR